MNKAARAENKIDNICQQLGISSEGHFWLDHAVDPFKDLVRPHPGMCDKTTNPSVVEVVKQTVNVSAPGAGNWDCNIFLDQVLQSISLYSTTAPGYVRLLTGQGATPYTRGGLVVRKAASGTSLDITTTDNTSCMEVNPAFYTNEDCRIVAIGFEVHDTTQELKKQGSMVAYRVDQPVEPSVMRALMQDNGVTACISTCPQVIPLTNPPFTLAESLDIIGSQQWEAKEGVYSVPVLVQDTNPPVGCRNPNIAEAVEAGTTYFPLLTSTGAAKLIAAGIGSVSPNPWTMSGAFFSGLDPAATLTVNFNFMIERFPNKLSTIRRLCYPSPPHDPRALELYSQIAKDMPVGVSVDQNGLGDWISGIANLAGGVLSMIPHPIPKMIGAGINALGRNKQVMSGANSIVKAIEGRKMNNNTTILEVYDKSGKEIACVTEGSGPTKKQIKNAVKTASAATGGNYRPPRQPGFKRPNRLKQVGQGIVVADNPWKKQKK